MNLKKLAVKNYKRFCSLEGSEYIATEFALVQILKIIKIFKIRSILEIGLGIGAIVDSVLKYSENSNYKLSYYGTEANAYCNQELKKNIEYFQRVKISNSLEEINTENKFDFIIIDGLDDSLEKIVSYCKKRTIIFIEGDRSPQTEVIMSLFPKARHVNIISLKKNREYSHGNPEFFMGGGRVIFTNPDIKMLAYYWKERVMTFIKRQLRKLV